MRRSRRKFLLTGATATLSVGAGCTSLLEGENGRSGDDEDDGKGDGNENGDPIPAADWPSFQRSPRNDGYATSAAPTAEPSKRWTTTLSGAIGDQVAVVDGTVYAATDDGTVHALEAANGDERWAESLEGGRTQCPCVVDGRVVVGTDAGELVALNAANGKREWTAELAGPVAGPTAADGTVYVGTSEDPTAYAVDATDGDELWSTGLGLDAVDYPAVTDDGVYIGAERSLEGELYALDPIDGDERWVHEGSRMQSPTVIEGDIVAPSLTVEVLTASGVSHRQFGFRGHVLSSPAATSDALFAGSTGGRFAAVDRGHEWNTDVGGRPISAPAVTDEAVYLTNGGPELVALAVETGDQRWSRPLEGEFATGPTVADDAVFVGTDAGELVVFD